MKPDGRAENVLEQMLWSYAMGCVRDHTGALVVDPEHPLQLSLTEVTLMYRSTSGLTPRRDDVQKWLGSVNTFLRTLPKSS